MSRSSNSVRGELMQGKPRVDSMACVVGHCSGENPAWRTYAASGNIALCLKTDTRLAVTSDFDP